MVNSEVALRSLARLYSTAVAKHGGKSLARVATITVNRGSFFTSLESGSTCSVRNFDKLVDYFRDPTNWPGTALPDDAAKLLAELGRPVKQLA